MIIKGAENETLEGFKVFHNENGYPCEDIYAMTEFGKLMRKNGGKWDDVPKRGEYIVQYGGGCLEVW